MKKQRLIIESIRYIKGQQKSLKLQGKKEELQAFQAVVNASRKLYENLQRNNVKLEEIESLVAAKNKAAQKFQEITGQSWPL